MYYITVICSVAGWAWLLMVAGFIGGYVWCERVQKRSATLHPAAVDAESTPTDARQ